MGAPRRRYRRRLQAVLRHPVGQEEARPGVEAGPEERVGGRARHRPRSRRRVDQLASAGGAQAEGAGQADPSSTRSPRARSARRSPRATSIDQNLVRAQETPPHSRSAVRLHAVARAVEEGADGTERRPRPERRRPAHRRSRGRAAGVPGRRAIGISRRACAERAANSVATLSRLGADRLAIGKDFDAATGPRGGRNARLLTEADGRALVERAQRASAVDGHRGRGEAGHRASGAALHDVDADAGGEPQARILDRAHDAGRRSGCFRGSSSATAGWTGTSPITAPIRRRSATKRWASRRSAINQMFGDEYYRGPRQYHDEGQERSGSARGDPADQLRQHARVRCAGSSMPTTAAVRADLEAHDGVADGRRARAAHDASRSRRRAPTASRRVHRLSGKAIEFAGFLRAYVEGSDDPAASSTSRRPCCRSRGRRSRRSSRRRRTAALVRLDPKRHETTPPPRYTEASLVKDARGGQHRPAVHLRVDHRHHSNARLRVPPGQGAGTELHGVRGHPAAARPFRRLVDVEFTAKMEEDLDEISRGEREWLDFIRAVLSRRRHHRGLEGAVEQARARRLSADRRRRRSGNRGTVQRARRPLRSVSADGRRRARQHRIAAADASAGGPDGREGDGADSRESGRAAAARRRSERPA